MACVVSDREPAVRFLPCGRLVLNRKNGGQERWAPMTNFSETQLMLATYLSCAWTSFGVYAVSDKPWTCRDALGRIIHGANAGMIMGFISFRFIGLEKPWQFIGLACSTSAGWTSKDHIKAVLENILKGK